ncbi:MAG: MCE family protein [Deltaproteobacteria bacterium]|nr:MCE family protein [Deltaproteobacteria bacterium]
MSKKPSFTMIGIFVVGAIGLVVLGLILFGSGKLFKHRTLYVLFFEGSVKGLNPGAPVDFRGVKIGTVKDIKVMMTRKDLVLRIPVIIEIEPERITETQPEKNQQKALERTEAKTVMEWLILKGLKAQLGIQSLVTGQLYVSLDFFPEKPLNLVGEEPSYPEIPTVPSSLDQFLSKLERLPLEEIMGKVMLALEGIADFVHSPELKDTLQSLNQAVKDVQALIRNLDSKSGPLATSLQETVNDIQRLVRSLEQEVKPVLSGLSETLKDTRTLMRTAESRVPAVTSSLENTFKAAEGAAKQAEKTLHTVETMATEHGDIPYELAKALKELSATARSLRTVADTIERHPEALIKGKQRGW